MLCKLCVYNVIPKETTIKAVQRVIHFKILWTNQNEFKKIFKHPTGSQEKENRNERENKQKT